MRFWELGNVDNGYGQEGIIFDDHDRFGRILSISVSENNEIKFIDEFDNYAAITMPKEHAITALQEAIAWIEKQNV